MAPCKRLSRVSLSRVREPMSTVYSWCRPPRRWDHPLAGYGTTSTVPGRMSSSVRVRRIDGAHVAYREITVIEIKEVLRLWLQDRMGLRPIAETVGVDRKTVRRYIDAAVAAGLVRDGGEAQLTDALIGAVIEAVRPERPAGHGAAWEACRAEHDRIKAWLEKDLKLTKVEDLLARRGVEVPYRTLHRYAADELGFGGRGTTVPVVDGQPGHELQVDFGRMGMMFDPVTGRRRALWALIFTAHVSRHTFVWCSWRQQLEDVIAGCEAAWTFYGGVFRVLIPDNMKSVVDRADPLVPRLNVTFTEYAQARGFVIDPARVRKPQDKPLVERTVTYVRGSFFAGEEFADLADAQRRAIDWCRGRAGMRVHGTIQARPAEVFRIEEAPVLTPAPTGPYDLPIYANAKVH